MVRMFRPAPYNLVQTSFVQITVKKVFVIFRLIKFYSQVHFPGWFPASTARTGRGRDQPGSCPFITIINDAAAFFIIPSAFSICIKDKGIIIINNRLYCIVHFIWVLHYLYQSLLSLVLSRLIFAPTFLLFRELQSRCIHSLKYM